MEERESGESEKGEIIRIPFLILNQNVFLNWRIKKELSYIRRKLIFHSFLSGKEKEKRLSLAFTLSFVGVKQRKRSLERVEVEKGGQGQDNGSEGKWIC